MKKALIVSTVSRQFTLFERVNIQILRELGYEVHGAANFEDANEMLDEIDIIFRPFDIQRSPFTLKNIKAYRQLKKIITDGNYDLIHCHSPMGGVLTRLAAQKARKQGTKVIYTAHGFHFYKGAPSINWLLYYPIERWLARYTDVLITINKEDYERAKTFKAKKVCYIPSVGVDTQRYVNTIVDKVAKRAEIGVPKNAIMLLSVGELNKNKNHEIVIRAIGKINDPNLYYVICGKGQLFNYLNNLCKELKVSKNVILCGFRNDIAEICQAADIYVFPSFREGLSVALIEAMAGGLPVIASKIRGNVDLLQNGQGGYLLDPNDVAGFAETIQGLAEDKALREQMGQHNPDAVKQFDVENVKKVMYEIYSEVLKRG